MAEQRTKTHGILLSVNSKRHVIDLYSAELWPEHSAGDDLYRVRLDGRWHCPMGKYSFLTPAAVGALVATLLTGGAAAEAEEMPEWIVPGLEIRAHYGECVQGMPVEFLRGYALDTPQLGPDGRWYVFCHIYGKGRRFLPAADVEPGRR